jgi:oxygen-independent coproporphyrinogen-3 oxidase
VRDLEEYIAGVNEGRDIVDETEVVPKRGRSGEYLMLRLRTTGGIEEWEYRREYFMNFDPLEAKLSLFEHNGWATRADQRWRLTPKGFLLSNQLIGQLLECQEEATLDTILPRCAATAAAQAVNKTTARGRRAARCCLIRRTGQGKGLCQFLFMA